MPGDVVVRQGTAGRRACAKVSAGERGRVAVSSARMCRRAGSCRRSQRADVSPFAKGGSTRLCTHRSNSSGAGG
jgi:hypothetical protein